MGSGDEKWETIYKHHVCSHCHITIRINDGWGYFDILRLHVQRATADRLPPQTCKVGAKELVSTANISDSDGAVGNKSFTHHAFEFTIGRITHHALEAAGGRGSGDVPRRKTFTVTGNGVDQHVTHVRYVVGGNQHVVDAGLAVREVKVMKTLDAWLEFHNARRGMDLEHSTPIGTVVRNAMGLGHSVKREDVGDPGFVVVDGDRSKIAFYVRGGGAGITENMDGR